MRRNRRSWPEHASKEPLWSFRESSRACKVQDAINQASKRRAVKTCEHGLQESGKSCSMSSTHSMAGWRKRLLARLLLWRSSRHVEVQVELPVADGVAPVQAAKLAKAEAAAETHKAKTPNTSTGDQIMLQNAFGKMLTMFLLRRLLAAVKSRRRHADCSCSSQILGWCFSRPDVRVFVGRSRFLSCTWRAIRRCCPSKFLTIRRCHVPCQLQELQQAKKNAVEAAEAAKKAREHRKFAEQTWAGKDKFKASASGC